MPDDPTTTAAGLCPRTDEPDHLYGLDCPICGVPKFGGGTEASAAPKPIKCGQCQQPMTVDEFFSDDHPCLTEPEKTIDEAMSQWNL